MGYLNCEICGSLLTRKGQLYFYCRRCNRETPRIQNYIPKTPTQFKKGHIGVWNKMTENEKLDYFIKQEQIRIDNNYKVPVDYRKLGEGRPVCIYCKTTIKPAMVIYANGQVGVECGNPSCSKELYK